MVRPTSKSISETPDRNHPRPTNWVRRARIISAILAACAAIHTTALLAADSASLRWTNTIGYDAAFRLGPANSALLANPNADDGDRNFAPGLISNRIDLLSVLDLSRGNFGAHASAFAWFDTVYNTSTDNDSATTYNATSKPNTAFTRAVRNLHGQHFDLDDAYLYGTFALDDIPVSIRLGRHTLLWGESVFFDKDAIASAQAPVDYTRDILSQASYTKNAFLPTTQISVMVQPQPDIALAFYYQFEWRKSRLPGVGSYFSYTDVLGAGSERFFVGPTKFLARGEDRTPPRGGQFGVSLHGTLSDFDIGLYALKYHSKYPILDRRLDYDASAQSEYVGEFRSVYPRDIELYGLSFSGYAGNTILAGEVSLRRHMPLVSLSQRTVYAGPQYGIDDYGYARGNTLHALVSNVATLRPAALWDSADLTTEFSANQLLDTTRNPSALDRSRDRLAMSVRILFEPRYFSVMPNLNITLPIGLGYNMAGQSSVDYVQNSGTGDLRMGVSAAYRSVWKADFMLTHYFGLPSRQFLADRDFVALRVERTF